MSKLLLTTLACFLGSSASATVLGIFATKGTAAVEYDRVLLSDSFSIWDNSAVVLLPVLMPQQLTWRCCETP